LTASIAAIINVNEMNGADSGSANAEYVKKIKNRIDSSQTQ
jgi:hypothetical protein